ncbi:hypothetical protein VTK56DRAFT_634 [Thermocarpiscus australiensis]
MTSATADDGLASRDGKLPSVVEAIKAYGLLPARPGERRAIKPPPSRPRLGKLPAELGRIKNPGLASLPGSFFGKVASGVIERTTPTQIQFLEPNTSLEDDVGELEADQDQVPMSSPESSADVLDEAGVEEPEADTEPVAEPKEFRFCSPSVLRHLSKGSWLALGLATFEQANASFTLDGWMPSRKWFLYQHLPSSAEEMAQKQRGPQARMHEWADKDYAEFCSLIDRCAAWEQSQAGSAMMLETTVAPDYIYINVSPPQWKTDMKPVSLRWRDHTQYDLETLPYEDLADNDYYGVTLVDGGRERHVGKNIEHSLKRLRVQKNAGAQQPKRPQGRPPKFKLQATKTMREHTAYPKSADDFLRAPGDMDEELDWSSENVRLAAFIVVSTLLGGVDRVVDWGLMLRLMPDQTISQLRHYWGSLRKDRLSTIVSLTEKFRRAFLKAYENNEIPPIDFDNILAYDWKFLIKWTTKLDLTERRTLPSSRKTLEEKFSLSKFKHGDREWRETYFNPTRSMFNRFQDATSEAMALSVDNISEAMTSADITLAMAWARSLCETPVEAYSAEAVLHKRNSLFPNRSKTEITELIMQGVEQLQRQGILSKSSSRWSNGRPWRFNTRVMEALEKFAQQEKFVKAVQFKKELDQAFRAGEEKKRVTYITNDGMIMALLNLQANGRVRVETTGQPNVPMGHEPGNYETRKYTKKYLHFRLDIVPTDSYLYDDDGGDLADLRARIKAAAPPTKGPGGAVPVWCDVFGKVDAERWLKYLSAVLITLASRGAMGAAELVKTLKPVIMLFEAELIVEWAERLGLLRAQLAGTAPAVMEWWWVAVEAQREGLTTARPRKLLPSARPARAAKAGAGGGGEAVKPS